MSKVTPPFVVVESETVKVKVVVPALPSSCDTSLTESVTLGVGTLHELSVVAVLRGLAAAAAKSVELLSVSVQPAAARMSALVVEGAGAFPVPPVVAPASLQFAVVP